MTKKQSHISSSWRYFIEVSPFYIFREDIHYTDNKSYEPPVDGLTVSLLDSSYIAKLFEVADGKTPVDALLRRFERGDKCLGVFKDEALVSFSWVTFNWLTFGCYRLPLNADEAYLFDMYVAPSCRGQNLAGYTRFQLYGYLIGQGRSRLFSVSLKGNKPALRFKKKLGGRIVDEGVSFKLCNRWRFGTKAKGEKNRA